MDLTHTRDESSWLPLKREDSTFFLKLMQQSSISLLPQLGKVDSFVIKDVLLLGAGSVLLKYDLKNYLNIKN